MLRYYLLIAILGLCHAQDDIVRLKTECTQYIVPPGGLPASTNSTGGTGIKQTILLWEAIVMIIAFGVFALLVTLIHRLVRTYVYYDAHLLDTFFDGGGDVNVAMVTCSVVAKWVWTAAFTWPMAATYQHGIAGKFWYAAGACIHLFLFAIVAVEIRIKAPGAKTYLQVIKARFGTPAHIILMIFAFITNILVSGMVITEGINIFKAVTIDLTTEVACIVIAISVGFFSVVGGVGGFIYTAFFSCILIMGIIIYFLTDVYYDPFSREGNQFGSWEKIYDVVQCGKVDNEAKSILTFMSQGGLMQGVLIIISSFTSVFVDQSYTQSAVSAKPGHSVWGFIMGGLTWFAIPFCAAFALGLPYWAWAIEEGSHLVSEEDANHGLLPVYVAQRLMGERGDFLMFIFTCVAIVTTASSQVLAASSIVLYDIYMTYISPFRSAVSTLDRQVSLRTQRVMKNEEYIEYDRRCVVCKHVVVICMTILLIPIGLAINATGATLPWLFKFLAVVVGSCVFPISLAIIWHRITGIGVAVGAVVGSVCGIASWLVYASQVDDGGLNAFYENTGRDEVFLVGTAVSLGAGGLFCIVISLVNGGCDTERIEEEEWEKTRLIDNPILPWSVKYATDVSASNMYKGRPHFYIVRRTFKSPEICAYIFGVLLAVLAVLVWPACMLISDIFTKDMFFAWTILVTVWGSFAAFFLILLPFIWEIAQICRQSYYNRAWENGGGKMERLEEDTPTPEPSVTRVPPAPQSDTRSFRSDSEAPSTMGRQSGLTDDGPKAGQRWKTFINLD